MPKMDGRRSTRVLLGDDQVEIRSFLISWVSTSQCARGKACVMAACPGPRVFWPTDDAESYRRASVGELGETAAIVDVVGSSQVMTRFACPKCVERLQSGSSPTPT